jgi:hypothetical protein
VLGKAGGFDPEIDLAALDGTDGFRISGEASPDLSGGSVSSAGDVNGDGFDDFIIGARGANSNGPNAGASYVVFGHGGAFDPDINLSSLDGKNGFQITGEAADDLSGASVSSAGDVNGDGFDDIVVGAISADANGNSSGASYVVFGKVDGFDASVNLSTRDGTNGFRIPGEAAGDTMGWSVSRAGDVNGDRVDDLIVGALFGGAAYVVFGKAGGFDVDLDLSALDGVNGFQVVGEAAGDALGGQVSGRET